MRGSIAPLAMVREQTGIPCKAVRRSNTWFCYRAGSGNHWWWIGDPHRKNCTAV